MVNQRWSRPIQVSAGVLAMLAAACTDAPVVPEPHDAIVPPPQSYASTGGSTVTMIDQLDGEVYTLNTGTREITRASDGAILELDGEQTAAAATAFYGNIVADAVLNDFDNICSSANPCGNAMAGTLDSTASGFILTKDSEDSSTHRGTRFGASFTGNPPLHPFSSSGKSFDLMSDGICPDIVNAVFQNKLDYAAGRTSFVKEAFISGLAVGAGIIARRILPVGSIPAARFMDKIAVAQDKRIAISVLGWMWNSYYCGSRQVTAGPVIRSFGGSSGGGGYLACHTESWLISFDGGKTSNRISVNVCEWAAD